VHPLSISRELLILSAVFSPVAVKDARETPAVSRVLEGERGNAREILDRRDRDAD
jgi:hypothetical protein